MLYIWFNVPGGRQMENKDRTFNVLFLTSVSGLWINNQYKRTERNWTTDELIIEMNRVKIINRTDFVSQPTRCLRSRASDACSHQMFSSNIM